VRVLCSEGIANHTGPESCVVHREMQVEPLTGESVRTVSVAHCEQVRLIAKQTTLTRSEAKEGKYGKDGRGILSSLVISAHLKLEPCSFTTARSVISLLGTKSMIER
jgi:hypothetical protein